MNLWPFPVLETLQTSGLKSGTPRVGWKMLLFPPAPSHLRISSREITLHYLSVHLTEHLIWLTSSAELLKVEERRPQRCAFRDHVGGTASLRGTLPGHLEHMPAGLAVLLCALPWIAVCSRLPTLLPIEWMDTSEVVWTWKGQSREGKQEGMCPVDGEPWSGGSGTSSILHAFVSHPGGYSYFSPLPHHGHTRICCLYIQPQIHHSFEASPG